MLGQKIRNHGLNFHCYADDTELYHISAPTPPISSHRFNSITAYRKLKLGWPLTFSNSTAAKQSSWWWPQHHCSRRLEILPWSLMAVPPPHHQKCGTWASSWTPPSHSSHISRAPPNLLSPTQYFKTPTLTLQLSHRDPHSLIHHLPSGLLRWCPVWAAQQGPW